VVRKESKRTHCSCGGAPQKETGDAKLPKRLHASKESAERPTPTTLNGVACQAAWGVRAVAVPVPVRKCTIAVGGEVVPAIRALAGRDGDFDQISAATDQQVRCQTEEAVEPLGEHAFGF
jgi:hypothetical protein